MRNSTSLSRPFSVLCGIFLALSLCFQPTLGFAADTLSSKKCVSHSFPVSLDKGKPATYQVTGNLCSQGDPSGKTIHVLVPGFTLTSTYWDFPYQPETYSYVDAINKSGYATLSLDRLGTGKSSKPPANEITVDRHAYIVSQVIDQLRAGKVQGYQFPKVILVGHSLGSIVSTVEAVKHGNIDGLILTGVLHTFNTEVLSLITGTVPAKDDPVFKDEDLPEGYLSLLKKTRQFFYHPDNTDPEIYEVDDITKGTGVANEDNMVSLLTAILSSPAIKVPVYLVMGSKDEMFCNLVLSCASKEAILLRERLLYTSDLDAFVLPNAGHNLNYQKNAPAYYKAVVDWSNKHVGTQ